MSSESCPLPTPSGKDEASVIARMLAANTIAIVGLSDDPSRASYEIASYLAGEGKTIIPINPNHQQVMGLPCYPSLMEAPPAELVNVFRRPEFCANVTREAISVGAKGVWLQSGIRNDDAQRLAAEAGIDFVQNRCIMVEHMHRG